MLANFLDKSKPINFAVYLGLFFCFFITAATVNSFNQGFTWGGFFTNVLFLSFLVFIFLFYHFVVTKNQLTLDHTYAIYLFVLTAILFLPKLFNFKILIFALVHLFFLRKIYSLYSPKGVVEKIFDCGFWLGTMFLLEPFSIVFYFLIIAAVLIHQKVTITVLLSPVIGFLTPLIIYFTYLFWNDALNEFIELFYLEIINSSFFHTKDPIFSVFIILLLLSSITIILKSPRVLSISNSFKKNWILLILNLGVTVVYIFLIPEKTGAEIIFFTIPSTIIIANGFEIIKKSLLKNILFWTFLMVSIGYFLVFIT